MMRWAMIEGKCGLLALQCPCRGANASLRTGRASLGCLGRAMMRRMSGRYKAFRCARMGAGVKKVFDRFGEHN